jgi:hypothetical protein
LISHRKFSSHADTHTDTLTDDDDGKHLSDLNDSGETGNVAEAHVQTTVLEHPHVRTYVGTHIIQTRVVDVDM